MAVFTKDEILAMDPCYPWNPLLIQAYPNDSFNGLEMQAYIGLQECPSSPYPWLMGRDVTLATEFIEVVGRDVNQKDINGETALHFAVIHLNVPLITYLLSQGANKELANDAGITPIKQALLTGNTDVIAAMGV